MALVAGDDAEDRAKEDGTGKRAFWGDVAEGDLGVRPFTIEVIEVDFPWRAMEFLIEDAEAEGACRAGVAGLIGVFDDPTVPRLGVVLDRGVVLDEDVSAGSFGGREGVEGRDWKRSRPLVGVLGRVPACGLSCSRVMVTNVSTNRDCSIFWRFFCDVS